MKTAYILYDHYLSPDGNKISVGGIQTYLTNLIPLLREAGYNIHMYQRASRNFEKTKDGILIIGVACEGKKREFVKLLKKIVTPQIDKENDLLLFGCETLAFESKEYRSIAIQHGIFWDIPFKYSKSSFNFFLMFLHKVRRAWQTVRRVSKVRQLVCVDNNFVNWYRALTPYPLIKLKMIPNFTEVPQSFPVKPVGRVNVIFARRFFEYRGTRLFAEAIEPILKERDDVSITIAGAGPEEAYLKEKLNRYHQVSFITYSSEESLAIHADKHIAVVPTLGSEGTSLSLLEAMASGCAVICTNVGGMTNIVLDHYNGLMISPDVHELLEALKELINDADLRKNLSSKAYDTISASFSLEKWQSSWRKLIVDTSSAEY